MNNKPLIHWEELKSDPLHILRGSPTRAVAIDQLQELMDELLGEQEPPPASIVTHGRISMMDLLVMALKSAGPSKVSISTFGLSISAAQQLAKLVRAGAITELHCLLSDSTPSRAAEAYATIKAVAKHITLAANHSKSFLLEADNRCLSVISSANFGRNDKLEVAELGADEARCNWHQAWLTEAIGLQELKDRYGRV